MLSAVKSSCWLADDADMTPLHALLLIDSYLAADADVPGDVRAAMVLLLATLLDTITATDN